MNRVMKNIVRFIGLLALSNFLSLSAAIPQSSNIQTASRSVVRVAAFGDLDGAKTFIGHGSGVVIAPDKILTNDHVVSEADIDGPLTFLIIPSDGKRGYEARVIERSPKNDLAILQLTESGRLTPAHFFTGNIGDGQDVFAIGYPAKVDLALEESEADQLSPQTPVKTRGNISAGRSAKGYETLLHTAAIAPGNSGGPLEDACGRVVGINSFGSTGEDGGADFFFAISMREVAAFLRRVHIDFASDNKPCLSAAELSHAEELRANAAKAKIDADAHNAELIAANDAAKKQRIADLQVIVQRENATVFAAFMMLLSLVASAVTYHFFTQQKRTPMIAAAAISTALFLAGIFAYALRPAFMP